MADTLKDILPPPPHEIVKEFAQEVKNALDTARVDVKNVAEDLAPHKVIGDLKPEMPPAPPKPPKPPRLSD